MPDLDFLIQTIQNDFDVDLVATCDEAALFAKLRKGGSRLLQCSEGGWRTHVMGVWHFVLASTEGSSFQTRQWHVPRFEMARALRQQDHFFKSEKYQNPNFASWMPLPTFVHGRHRLEFQLGESARFHLPESFVQEMKKDLPLLEKAKQRVRERDNSYYIPRMKTAAGHPVEYKKRELLEAIAFEKGTYARMTAGNFGVYSAFCSYRDFDTAIEMPHDIIRELVDAQLEYDPEDSPVPIHQLFLETQKRLFSRPIWGRGVEMSVGQAFSVVEEALAKLTRPQRVQIILMQGMHEAGLLLPLAAITGVCDYEDYAQHMCRYWGPNSPLEQERRMEIAYMKLYGQLASSAQM